MGVKRSASLSRRYPRRIEIPVLLVGAGCLLAAGITLPALETRTLFFWKDEYSIFMNVMQLGRDDRAVAASILALCSIIYPAAKLLTLIYFWVMPFPHTWRARLITLLRAFGRWSMVDVFAVTAIVLASLTIGPLEAEPKIGLFCYAAGIITLMFAGLLMERIAMKGGRRR